MKNGMKIILLLLTAITVFGQSGEVALTIETNRNAIIILDDTVYYGKTFTGKVHAGKHIVKIKSSFRNWDLDTIIDTLNVSLNEPRIKRKYQLPELVFLQTSPDDASVLSGEKFIGHTPLYLPVNLKKVLLLKNNFVNKNVELSGDKIFLNLEKARPELSSERFIDDVWFKVLLGGIVGFGATSAYFKLKADKYYDEYLKTKNEDLLNKTNNYDLISGIALGALQINFGILIYHFLIE